MLVAEAVRAGYDQGDVIFGVDLRVDTGSLVTLLGPNGAGKSTLLKIIAGVVRPTGGRLRLLGSDVTGRGPSELARCGVYLVPEDRAVFATLSVRENLRMSTGRPERSWGDALDRALDAFPKLGQRINQTAGTMSGGEQQMLALARAYVAQPLLLLLDEPSLGLAPIVVDEVFDAIERFRRDGMTVMLVEQYVHRALEVADHVVVLEKGAVAFSGGACDVRADDLAARYLGVVS